MTQAITKPQTKPVTFDDFIASYLKDSLLRYELNEGG